MSSNKFKFNRRTPAIYIGNESVNLVWKKNIEIEKRTKENATRLDVVETVAADADQRSKDNTGRLDTVQGVANEANERSKRNLTRLDSVDGTAKAAKALAESNQKLLSTVEGTANGAKALATECRTLIDGKANVGQLTFSNVHLRMEEKRMLIVAPKGLIDIQKCQVSFARYVRSSYRVKDEHGTPSRPKGHYRRKGWIVPMWRRGTEDNRLVTAIVHMRMTKINEIDGMEYFLLSASPNAFDEGRDEATYTFDNNIGGVFLYLCKKAVENKISLHLWDKKLGVCITMNGQPITPYLPFTVRFNELVNNNYGSFNFDKVTPSLSRWI